MPDPAAVSDRALIGFRAAFRSFVQPGTKPHFSTSSRRSPVSGCRRMTMASCVGAAFQFGGRLGTDPAVANSLCIRSAGIWEAKRPHMEAG